jgi:pimeloyl-ACP methyl ester carboxylesterase
MPAHLIATPDGPLLSVRVTGQAGGPAVLLCDGVGCDGYIWRYLRPVLERRCQVVHFHYRGHGQSEVPDDQRTMTIEQSARDAWTVLDHLGIQRATLMGHSMGVQVILTAAHQHPERTVALVPMCGAFEKPLDTFQGSDVGSKLLPFLTGAALRYQVGLRKLWQRWVPTELAYQLAVATEINPKMIRRDDFLPYLTHMARLDPLVFLAFLQSAAHHSAREWLPQLQIPALVVAGLRDHFTPGRLQAELVQLLPDAELLEIPGGSHTAPLELPELIELRLELWSRARGLGLI